MKLKTEYIEVLNKSSKSINIKPVVIKAKNKHKQTACEPITNVSKPKPMLPLTVTQSPPFCHGITSIHVPLASSVFGPIKSKEIRT